MYPQMRVSSGALYEIREGRVYHQPVGATMFFVRDNVPLEDAEEVGRLLREHRDVSYVQTPNPNRPAETTAEVVTPEAVTEPAPESQPASSEEPAPEPTSEPAPEPAPDVPLPSE